jgi:hypothetical protein
VWKDLLVAPRVTMIAPLSGRVAMSKAKRRPIWTPVDGTGTVESGGAGYRTRCTHPDRPQRLTARDQGTNSRDALGPGLKSLVGFESPSSSRTARPRIGCIARPKGRQIMRMLTGSKAKSTHKDSLSAPADKIGSPSDDPTGDVLTRLWEREGRW